LSGVKIKINSKIKVKSSGQECPLHTGKGNVNNRTAGCRGFPLLAKDARSGAPLSDEGAIEVKINVKGNGQECPFQTSKVNNKINVKSGASGVRVPTFRKRGERWGSLFVVLCSGSQNPRPFGFAQGRLCPSKERRD
jgi:hypothetical protein